MRIWRVVHVNNLDAPWSAAGARLKGGRWNSPGRAVVYTSEHAALAVVEQLAYFRPQQLSMFRLVTGTLPGAHVTTHAPDTIPDGWDAYPHGTTARAIGDAFLTNNASVGLKVPSSLVPGYNVLLNPNHPEFHQFEPEAAISDIPLAQRAPKT